MSTELYKKATEELNWLITFIEDEIDQHRDKSDEFWKGNYAGQLYGLLLAKSALSKVYFEMLENKE